MAQVWLAMARNTIVETDDDDTDVPEGAKPHEKGPAVVTHVLGLLTLFVGPLVMYFIYKRNASPWLRAHLDEAVNYHILVVAAVILLIVVAVVLTSFGFATIALIAFMLLFLVIIANVIFSILAIIWAGRGKSFHFPLDIKMIR